MQSDNRFFDDAAKLAGGAIGTLAGLRREIEALAREGIAKFPPDTALYIRPTMFSDGGLKLLVPDPDSTCFALTLWATPMAEPTGFSACLSPYRRPTPESAPTG